MIFAQTRDTHGGGYEVGDMFHSLSELFKSHHDDTSTDAGGVPLEQFRSTIRPIMCNYMTFDPEIPKGKRAVIDVEGNEQSKNPRYGAIDVYVSPGWTPTKQNEKPPSDPKFTFGGDGGCWVSGPGRLTIHLRTDIIPAPKVTIRIEDMP